MVISGGTLKIYGHLVNPDVPYKTLLLSVSDNAAHVVRETLEKYGMDKENPDAFCLVQVRHVICNVRIYAVSCLESLNKKTLVSLCEFFLYECRVT